MKAVLVALFIFGQLHAAIVSVCASGCTYTAAQAAVDAAVPGDVVEFSAGETFTVAGGLILRNKSNPTGPYVVIRSNKCYAITQRATLADTTYMASLRMSGGTNPVILVEQGASHYRIECLDISLNPLQDTFSMIKLFYQIGGGVGDSQITQLPHHFIFDRNYIHGVVESPTAFSRCIAANTGYIEITNNLITDCYAPGSAGNEVQAIAGWNTRGPIYVNNNQITASQIGTLWGGAVPAIAGLRPTGIFTKGNYYYRPWKWRVKSGATDPTGTCLWDASGGEWYNQTASVRSWRCVSGTWTNMAAGVTTQPTTLNKNHYELKNTWGAVAEGNYLANGWYPTMLNQHGAAILVNQVDNSPAAGAGAVVNAFAKFQNNFIIDTPWGSSNGALGTYFYQTHDISIANNIWKNIGAYPQSNSSGTVTGPGEAVAFQSTSQGRYDVLNNTIIMTSTSGSRGTAFAMDTTPAREMNYVGNIQNWGNYGFYDSQNAGGALWNAVPNQLSNWNLGLSVIPNDQSCTIYANPCPTINLRSMFAGAPNVNTHPMACPSCAVPANWAAVGFEDFAAGDYRLDSASTYKGTGPYGLDPGAKINQVEWSTATAISGAANPYLNFDVLALTVASTTAFFRYLAYEGSEYCNLLVSPDANYVGTAYSNVTSASGDRDITNTATGLSANTRYWWRVTASPSGHYREGVFITRP